MTIANAISKASRISPRQGTLAAAEGTTFSSVPWGMR
jgi:hypothetical protein